MSWPANITGQAVTDAIVRPYSATPTIVFTNIEYSGTVGLSVRLHSSTRGNLLPGNGLSASLVTAQGVPSIAIVSEGFYWVPALDETFTVMGFDVNTPDVSLTSFTVTLLSSSFVVSAATASSFEFNYSADTWTLPLDNITYTQADVGDLHLRLFLLPAAYTSVDAASILSAHLLGSVSTVFTQREGEIGGSGLFERSYLLVEGGVLGETAAIGTGDFTWECWVYPMGTDGYQTLFDTRSNGGGSTDGFFFGTLSGTTQLLLYTNTVVFISSLSMTINSWNHVALTRSANTVTAWINGANAATGNGWGNLTNARILIGGFPGGGNSYFSGYISNVRMVKGTSVYTEPFTPSLTAALTAIAGTQLLLLNTSGETDSSPNNFAVLVGGGHFSWTLWKPSPTTTGTATVTITPKHTSSPVTCTVWWRDDNTMGIIPNLQVILHSDLIPVRISGQPVPSPVIRPYSLLPVTVVTGISYNGSAGLCVRLHSSDLSRGDSGNLAAGNGLLAALFTDGTGKQSVSIVSDGTFWVSSPGEIFKVIGFDADIPLGVELASFSVFASSSPSTLALTSGTGPSFDLNNRNNWTASIGGLLYSPLESVGLHLGLFLVPSAHETPNAAAVLDSQSLGSLTTSWRYELEMAGSVVLVPWAPLSINGGPGTAMGTGDFTWECWVWSTARDGHTFFDTRSRTGDRSDGFYFGIVNSNSLTPAVILGDNLILSSAVDIAWFSWTHVALTRHNGILTIWVDGAFGGMVADGTNLSQESVYITGNSYMSNARIVKGTAVYTQAFTRPSESLTAISGTQLLLLYTASDNMNDSSANKFVVTSTPYSEWSGNTPIANLHTLPTIVMDFVFVPAAQKNDQSDVLCTLWWRDDNTMAKIANTEVTLHYMSGIAVQSRVHAYTAIPVTVCTEIYYMGSSELLVRLRSSILSRGNSGDLPLGNGLLAVLSTDDQGVKSVSVVSDGVNWVPTPGETFTVVGFNAHTAGVALASFVVLQPSRASTLSRTGGLVSYDLKAANNWATVLSGLVYTASEAGELNLSLFIVPQEYAILDAAAVRAAVALGSVRWDMVTKTLSMTAPASQEQDKPVVACSLWWRDDTTMGNISGVQVMIHLQAHISGRAVANEVHAYTLTPIVVFTDVEYFGTMGLSVRLNSSVRGNLDLLPGNGLRAALHTDVHGVQSITVVSDGVTWSPNPNEIFTVIGFDVNTFGISLTSFTISQNLSALSYLGTASRFDLNGSNNWTMTLDNLLYSPGESGGPSPSLFLVPAAYSILNAAALSAAASLGNTPVSIFSWRSENAALEGAATLSIVIPTQPKNEPTIVCALWWRDDNTMAIIPGVEVILHLKARISGDAVANSVHPYGHVPVTVLTNTLYTGTAGLSVRVLPLGSVFSAAIVTDGDGVRLVTVVSNSVSWIPNPTQVFTVVGFDVNTPEVPLTSFTVSSSPSALSYVSDVFVFDLKKSNNWTVALNTLVYEPSEPAELNMRLFLLPVFFSSSMDASALLSTTSSWNHSLFIGGSVLFNNSYLTVSGNSGTAMELGDFTWECWIYPTLNSENWQALIDTRSSNANVDGFLFAIYPGTMKLVCFTYAVDFVSSTSMTINAWNHVALTRSSSNVTMWINGTSGGTVSRGWNLGNQRVYIGGVGQNFLYSGHMTNLRMVKGTALYTQNFTITAAELSAVPGTQLLLLNADSAHAFRDSSPNNFSVVANGTVAWSGQRPLLPVVTGNANLVVTPKTPEDLSDVPCAIWWQDDTTLPTKLDGVSAVLHFISGEAVPSIVHPYSFTPVTVLTDVYYPGLAGLSVRLVSSLSLSRNGCLTADLVVSQDVLSVTIVSNSTDWIPEANETFTIVGYDAHTPAVPLLSFTVSAQSSSSLVFPGASLFDLRKSNNWTMTLEDLVYTSQQAGQDLNVQFMLVPNTYSAIDAAAVAAVRSLGILTSSWDVQLLGTVAVTLSFTPARDLQDLSDIPCMVWWYDVNTAPTKLTGANAVLHYISGDTICATVQPYSMSPVTVLTNINYTGLTGLGVKLTSSSSLRNGLQVALVTVQDVLSVTVVSDGTAWVAEADETFTIVGYNIHTSGVALMSFGIWSPSTLVFSRGETSLHLWKANNWTVTLDGLVYDSSQPAEQDLNVQFMLIPDTYNSANANAVLASQNLGTLTSRWEPPPLISGSAKFDRSYLTVDGGSLTAMGTANFTWECWVYPTASVGWQTFIDTRSDFGGSTNGLYFGTPPDSLQVIIYSISIILRSSLSISINAWNHIAVTRASTVFTVWVNGANGGSASNVTDLSNTSVPICIGGSPYNNNLTGYMTNLRIVKGSALYTQAFTPYSQTPVYATGMQLLLASSSSEGLLTDSGPNNFHVNVHTAGTGSVTWSTKRPTATAITSVATIAISPTGGQNLSDVSCALWWRDNNTLPKKIIGANVLLHYISGEAVANTVRPYTDTPVTVLSNLYHPGTLSLSVKLNSSTRGEDPAGLLVSLSNSGQSVVITYDGSAWIPDAAETFTVICYNDSTPGIPLTTFTVSSQPSTLVYAGTSSFHLRNSNGYAMTFGNVIYGATETLRYNPFEAADLHLKFMLVPATLTNIDAAAVLASQALGSLTSLWEHRPIRGSAQFGNSYLAVDGGNDMAMGTGNFTWECWGYFTVGIEWQTLLDTRSGNGADGLFLGIPAGTIGLSVLTTDAVLLQSSLGIQVNAWNHIALTRDTGGTLKIWVNGFCGGTLQNNSTNLTRQQMYIGGVAGANYLSGLMTNVRVVKGTALYTHTFTPLLVALTAIEGTKLLLLNNNTAGLLTDSSPNHCIVTAGGSVVWTPQTPPVTDTAIFGVAALAIAPASPQNCSDVPCAVWWHDDNTMPTKLSGVDAVLYYISGDAVANTVHPFSYTPIPVFVNLFLPGIVGFSLKLSSSTRGEDPLGLVASIINNGSSIAISYDGEAWIPASNETFTVICYNDNTPGVSLTSFTVSAQPSTLVFSDSSLFAELYKSNNWTKAIDGLVYTPSELIDLNLKFVLIPSAYTNFDATSLLEARSMGTLTSSWTPTPIGGSAQFSDSYLTVDGGSATAIGTGDFTWECWCYLHINQNWQTLFDSRNDTGADGLFFGLSPTTATLTALTRLSGIVLQSVISAKIYGWNHAALTRESGTLKIWVNGICGGTLQNNYTNLTQQMHIGGYVGGGGNYLVGAITNLRIVKGNAVYKTAFKPLSGSLSAITGTQLLLLSTNSAGLLTDSSPNNLSVVASGSVVWTQQTPPTSDDIAGVTTLAIAPTPGTNPISCTLWWCDDNTMAERIPGVTIVVSHISGLTPNSQTSMVLNRLNKWSPPFLDVTYISGSPSDIFSAYIVPTPNTPVALVVALVPNYVGPGKRLRFSASFTAAPTMQHYGVYWDDANTVSTLYTTVMIPRHSSINGTREPAAAVPLLRFLSADAAIFTYTYDGDSFSSLRFFLERPGSVDMSALIFTSMPGLSVSAPALGSSVYVHVDHAIITDDYLFHQTSNDLTLYAYDDNTAPFILLQHITLQLPSIITDDAPASLTFHHLNNWTVAIAFSGVDQMSVLFDALPAQSDLLTVLWEPPGSARQGKLVIQATADHSLRQTGGTIFISWKDAFTSLQSAWKTCIFLTPTSMTPASALASGALTLNRLNNWRSAYPGIRYSGSYASTLGVSWSLRNSRAAIAGIANVNVDNVVTESANVVFTIDARTLRQFSDERYQMWWFDDTVEYSLYADISIPRQCSLGAFTYFISPTLPASRFSKMPLFQATYAGAVLARTSMRIFALSDRESTNVSLLKSSDGLSVTLSSFTLEIFIAYLTVDTSVNFFSDAYMRANRAETFQLYAYDDNTAAFCIPDSTFSLVQPSVIAPAFSSAEIKLQLHNNWTLQFPYTGVHAASIHFYALVGQAPSMTDTPPSFLTVFSNDTDAGVLTVAVDPTTLQAAGGTFDIWWIDDNTSLTLWKHMRVPPQARMFGAVETLVLNYGNSWSHTFQDRAYTGNAFLDGLQVYICKATESNTFVASVTSLSVVQASDGNLTIGLNMQPYVPAVVTAYYIWWSDFNTPPTLLATVPDIAASSVIIQKTNEHPTDVVSRLQDALPIQLLVASYTYRGSIDVSQTLQFIALPAPVPPSPLVHAYSSIAGLAITSAQVSSSANGGDFNVAITIDETEPRFSNDFLLAAPDTRYQVYAFDANTPITPVGESFTIETPTYLSSLSPDILYLTITTAWTRTLFFSGEQVGRNLRFFVSDATLNTIVVSRGLEGVTIAMIPNVSSSHVQVLPEAFTLFWEDDVTTPVAWRSCIIPAMSTLTVLPGSVPPEIVNGECNWEWKVICEYVGSAFHAVSVYVLPASLDTFSMSSALATGVCSGIASRVSVFVPIASLQALASTSVRNSFKVWWKDPNTLPSSIGVFELGIVASVILVEPPLQVIRRFILLQEFMKLEYYGRDNLHFSVVAIPDTATFTDQFTGTRGLVMNATFSPNSATDVTVNVHINESMGDFTNAYLLSHQNERFQTYYFDNDTPPTKVGVPFEIQSPSIIFPAATTAATIIDTSNSFTANVVFSGVDIDTVAFSVFLAANASVPLPEAEAGIAFVRTSTQNGVRQSTFTISVPSTSLYRANYGSDGGTEFFVMWQDGRTKMSMWRRFIIPARSSILGSPSDNAHSILTGLSNPAWSTTTPVVTYSGSAMETLEFVVISHDRQTYSSAAVVLSSLAVIVVNRTDVTDSTVFSLTLDFSKLAATQTRESSAYNIWWSDMHTTWRVLRLVDVSLPSTFTPTFLYNIDYLFPDDNKLADVTFTSYDMLGSSVVFVATPAWVTRPEDVLANVSPDLVFSSSLRLDSSKTPTASILRVTASQLTGQYASKPLWYRLTNFRNWYFLETDEHQFNLWCYDAYGSPKLLNVTGVFTTRHYEIELNRGNDWTYTAHYTYSGDNPEALEFSASISNVALDYTPYVITRPMPNCVMVSIPNALLTRLSGLRMNLVYKENETPARGVLVDFSVTPYPAQIIWKVFNISIDLISEGGISLDVEKTADGALSTLSARLDMTALSILSAHNGAAVPPIPPSFTLWAFDVNTPLFQVSSTEFVIVYESTLSDPAPGSSHISFATTEVTLFEGITYTGNTMSTLQFSACSITATAYVPDPSISAAVSVAYTAVGNTLSVQVNMTESIFSCFADGSLPAFKIWASDANTPNGMPVNRIIYVERSGSLLPFTITDDSVSLNGANSWTYAGITVTSATPILAYAADTAVTAETFTTDDAISFAGQNVQCICTATADSTFGIVVIAASTFTGNPFRIWVLTADPTDYMPATRISTLFTVESSILSDIQRIAGTESGIPAGNSSVPLLTAAYIGTSIVKFIALPLSTTIFSKNTDMASAVQGVAVAYNALTLTVSAIADPEVFTLSYFHAAGNASFSVWAYETTSDKTFRVQERFDIQVVPSGLAVVQMQPPLSRALANGIMYTAAEVSYTPSRAQYVLQGVAVLHTSSSVFSLASALQGVQCAINTNGVLSLQVSKEFYALNNLPITVDVAIDIWLYDESTSFLAIVSLPVPIIFQTWASAVTQLVSRTQSSLNLVSFRYCGQGLPTIDARSLDGSVFPADVIILTTVQLDAAESIEVWVSLNFNNSYFLVSNPRAFSLFAYGPGMVARSISKTFEVIAPASLLTATIRAVSSSVSFQVLPSQTDVDINVCFLDYVAYSVVDTLVAVATVPNSFSTQFPLPLVTVMCSALVAGTQANGRRQIALRVSPSGIAALPGAALRMRAWLYDDNTPADIENSLMIEVVVSSAIGITPISLNVVIADAGVTTTLSLFTASYTGGTINSLSFSASIPGVSFSWQPPVSAASTFPVTATIAAGIWDLNHFPANTPIPFTVSASDNNTAVQAFDSTFSIIGFFQQSPIQKQTSSNFKLLDNKPALEIVYYGTAEPAAITARAVFSTWNTFPTDTAAFVPGVSASVSFVELQWKVSVEVHATAVSNFTSTVDEVYFDLWIYDTPLPDAPARLTTGGAFSISAALVVTGIRDGNAVVVDDDSLYMFPFNASYSNPEHVLICTIEVYGGKALPPTAPNLFNVYMQDVSSAIPGTAFPNALNIVQRGLASGVSFIDIFTSAANLQEGMSYTKAFKVVIVDALSNFVEKTLQFTSFPRQTYAFVIAQPSVDGIFLHEYNNCNAFSVSPVIKDSFKIGTLLLNGVDIDSRTTVSGYDAAVFTVTGAVARAQPSSLSILQKSFAWTATFLRHAFVVAGTALYVYPALEVRSAGAPVICSEGNIANGKLHFTARGGLGSFSASLSMQANLLNDGIPDTPRFVQDTSEANGLSSISGLTVSVAGLETSFEFGIALLHGLPTPAGGSTSYLTRYAGVTINAYGHSASSDVTQRVLVLIYSDLVSPRIQLQRLGCLGTETVVNLQNTALVFLDTDIIAGGYLDSTAFLTILPAPYSTSGTFQAAGLGIQVSQPFTEPSALLSFLFTDGRGASTETVSVTVSVKPTSTFSKPDVRRYLLKEDVSGQEDLGRFLYRHNGSYLLPQPVATNASVTSTGLFVSPYTGAEVLHRDWTPDSRVIPIPATNTQACSISGAFSDTHIYRVTLLYSEVPLSAGQLFRGGDLGVIEKSASAVLATHTYFIELIVENRALRITPSNGTVFDPNATAVNFIPPTPVGDGVLFIDYLLSTAENSGSIILGNKNFDVNMVVVCNANAPLLALTNVKYWDFFTLAIVPDAYVFSSLTELQAFALPAAALQFVFNNGSMANVLCTDATGNIASDGNGAHLSDVVGIVAPHYNPTNENYVLYFVHDVAGDIRTLTTYKLAFFANAGLVSNSIVLSRNSDLSIQAPDKLRLVMEVAGTLPDRLVFSLQCMSEGDDLANGVWTELAGNFDVDDGNTLADIQAEIQNADWPERDAAQRTLVFRVCLQNTLVKLYGVQMQASNVVNVSEWRDADPEVTRIQYQEFIFPFTNVHVRVGLGDDGVFTTRRHSTTRTIQSTTGYGSTGVRQVLPLPHIYLAYSYS